VASCLNCGAENATKFCPECGQKNRDYRESIGALVSEVVSEVLQFDSRVGRTIARFLLRPGELTNEYNAGRRARYSSPVRLYVFASLAYFFVFSIAGPREAFRFRIDGTDQQELSALGKSGSLKGAIARRVDELNRLEKGQQQERLLAGFANHGPKAAFFVLPIFAALLKLLYWKSGRFYIEHLIFSLHFHSFCFLLLLARFLYRTDFTLQAALAAMVVYLLFSMRAVYRQSWARTATKLSALLFCYSIVLGLAVGGVAVAVVLFA
jgi:hypothetical protein